MNTKVFSLIAVFALLAVSVSVAVFNRSAASQPRFANSNQGKQKKLREIAMERDVEVEGPSGCDLADMSLADLSTSSSAVVYGWIIDSKSFFDESSPSESGDYITTEYTVEILRVLKDKTLETMPPPDKQGPAPLTTPLKIARNGGTVNVNGHRAAVKVKGYDALSPGKQYVFFLNWSPDYHAYKLTYCIFGALMVNDDLSLRTLGSPKELQAEVREMTLESLFKRCLR